MNSAIPGGSHAANRYRGWERKGLPIPRFILPPLLLTAVLWRTQLTPVSDTQVALGFTLMCFPWWSYVQWKRGNDERLPFFSIISFVYWLFFAVPLFWGDRFAPVIGHVQYVSDASITGTLIMANLGMAALWFGMHARVGSHFKLPRLVDLSSTDRMLTYVRVILVITTLYSLFPDIATGATSSIRQVALTLQQTVPLMAYVILVRRMIRGERSRVDMVLALAYVATSLGVGVSHGVLGPSLLPIFAAVLLYLWDRRNLPVLPILLGLAFIMFFQPTKNIFRQEYADPTGGQSVASGASSPLQKAGSWVSTSLSTWELALTYPSSGEALALTRSTVLRTSLLTQTAHVLDWTPGRVPFQNGSTYTYLVTGLIPRALWPDKPSVNDANQFYQVAYDLTFANQLNTVSESSGSMTEGYINFGWPGVLIVMFLLGILFDFVSATFLSPSGGRFYNALGIVFLMQFIVIESQLSVYVSGLLQTTLVMLVVFFPVLQRVRAADSAAAPS